jgi:dihydrofolate reductase/thymidylate synthase
MFNIILATDNNNGIGKNNGIPWNIPDDIELFKSLTSSLCGINKVVIMGYNTMKSLKNGYLKNRINIIITSKIIQKNTENENVYYVSNFNEALTTAYSLVGKDASRVWVIGGSILYASAINHTDLHLIYHSCIDGDYECDVKFELPQTTIISKNKLNNFILNVCQMKDTAEYQYLKLLNDVLLNGNKRTTRNGLVYSLFGKEMSFNVSNNFPLLTTKKMFMKGIIEELLFFIRGDTDTNKLMEQGINIWKGNTTREFLDNLGLHYKEGMMGPMYGYQWRFFGKDYQNANYHLSDCNNTCKEYVDQFKNIIETLKKDPNSRRLIMTDFNPAMVDEGVLYPCHSLIIQFYVNKTETNNKLSIKMYQRSADLFLGLPFNIASTSLLLYIVAKLVEMEPDNVHITLGDCHIYDCHINQVKEQIKRQPYKFPKLNIPDFKTIEEVEQSNYKEFILEDYNCHPSIKADMVA